MSSVGDGVIVAVERHAANADSAATDAASSGAEALNLD
jgi:hypothetical protein